MIALETNVFDQSSGAVALYAVRARQVSSRARRDRVDLLNKQVTPRGHCTIHVLRDRQLAANHPVTYPSTVLSKIQK